MTSPLHTRDAAWSPHHVAPARPPLGFILTRHVVSVQTNRYWNHCVEQIHARYPGCPIVIIDDASVGALVRADATAARLLAAPIHAEESGPPGGAQGALTTALTVVASEFPGRGELLPFLYFARHRWFRRAVMMHDSTFLQTRVLFEALTVPAVPLWHAPYNREDVPNTFRLCRMLADPYGRRVQQMVRAQHQSCTLGMGEPCCRICFGAQCVMDLAFLLHLESKYRLTQLIPGVRVRADRCSFERVLGAILAIECPYLAAHPSLFGSIHRHHRAWTYDWPEYVRDVRRRRIVGRAVKIWSGR